MPRNEFAKQQKRPRGAAPPKDMSGRGHGNAPFWQKKPLHEMSAEEWESLCDGCGQCCLIKLEDEDTGDIAVTRLACKLLDLGSCQCSDYGNRQDHVPDCVKLTPSAIGRLAWLPETCAYRLLDEGKDLRLVASADLRNARDGFRGRRVDSRIGDQRKENSGRSLPGAHRRMDREKEETKQTSANPRDRHPLPARSASRNRIKGRRFNSLRSRIRLRLSGMTMAATIPRKLSQGQPRRLHFREVFAGMVGGAGQRARGHHQKAFGMAMLL